MAKQKIKNFKLEQEELKPVTIGVFESRKKSSVSIFIILTTFIVLVLFLPQISDLYNKYFNSDEVEIPEGGKLEPIKPPSDDEEDEDYHDTFYDYAIDLKIEREDITVGDFVVDTVNNTLGFKVTNNLSTSIILSDLDYYLELYTEDHTLLERLKITGDAIDVGGSNNYKKQLSTGVALDFKSFVLVKIDQNDYPAVNLTLDENGNSALVCSRPHETVTYKFTDNLLKEVSSEIVYAVTDNDYTTYASQYRNQATTYNGRPGITSTFLDINGAFTVSTAVDLSKAERMTIFNADTFRTDTEAKIVNFEMEAQGFDCE